MSLRASWCFRGKWLLAIGIALALLTGCESASRFLAKFTKEKEEVAEEGIVWHKEAPASQRNVALVLDNSGSMNGNDPSGLMLFSSLAFLDLLTPADQVFETGFPSKEMVSTDQLSTSEVNAICQSWLGSSVDCLGPAGATNQGLRDWVKALPYASQVTVFQEPLARALDKLKLAEPASAKRYIVLFTDGNTDRGGDRNPAVMGEVHRQEGVVLSSWVEDLRRQNITLYAVVLGTNTKDDHIRPLAEQSGGAVLRADKPEDLADKFAEVFGKVLETKVERLDLTRDNALTINRYAREFIVFIPTNGDVIRTSFEDEHGRKLAGEIAGKDGFIRRDQARALKPYQVVHVNDPSEGTWNLHMEGAEQSKALLLQNYAIYLQVYGTYPRIGLKDTPMVVRGRLVDAHGEPIQDPVFYEEGNFTYSFTYGDQQGSMKPNESFGFEFDVTPRDTLVHDLVLTATNDSWLTRRETVQVGGKEAARLNVSAPVNFGPITPYADGMYTWWAGSWVARLLGLPNAKDWKSNKAKISFQGTDRSLVGTVLAIDDSALYAQHNIRLTDGRHRNRVEIGEDLTATIFLDADRDAKPLEGLTTIPLKVPTDAGKIRGEQAMRVKADVKKLPWHWRTSHFWLQWLIYLWCLLFFLIRPLLFVMNYSTVGMSYTDKAKGASSSPSPTEGRIGAFIKGLVKLYPFGLVKSLRKEGDLYQLDGSSKATFRRILATLFGLPLGDYGRRILVTVDGKDLYLYKTSTNILMDNKEYASITGSSAPRKVGLRECSKFSYKAKSDKQCTFTISGN